MTTLRHAARDAARRSLALIGGGILGLALIPLAGRAAPYPVPTAPSPYYRSDYPPQGYAYRNPGDPAWLEAQRVQRCNIGRLVGGILGGGVGYAASREDGRTWAVPLGALLGTQMGCNVGTGRAPLPW